MLMVSDFINLLSLWQVIVELSISNRVRLYSFVSGMLHFIGCFEAYFAIPFRIDGNHVLIKRNLAFNLTFVAESQVDYWCLMVLIMVIDCDTDDKNHREICCLL